MAQDPDESVFDPLYKVLLRRAMNILGMGGESEPPPPAQDPALALRRAEGIGPAEGRGLRGFEGATGIGPAPRRVTGQADVEDPRKPLVSRATSLPDLFMRMANVQNPLELGGPTQAIAPIAGVLRAAAPKVAPRKAVNELVALLRGQSSRVPNIRPPGPLSDAEASAVAMTSSRIGGAPPKPTRLVVDSNLPVQGDARLRQAPEVAAGYRQWARLRGLNQHPQGDWVTVGPATTGMSRPPAIAVGNVGSREFQKQLKSAPLHETAAKANIKPMTSRELQNLVDGPKEAFRRGMISKEEMLERVAAGERRIAEHLEQIRGLELARYNESMGQRVEANVARAAARPRASAIARHAPIADKKAEEILRRREEGERLIDLANEYGYTSDSLNKVLRRFRERR
jgi:hypothetical protein